MIGGWQWCGLLLSCIGTLALGSCDSPLAVGDPCTTNADCDRGEDKSLCLLRFPDGYCSNFAVYGVREGNQGWCEVGFLSAFVLPTCEPGSTETQPCYVPSPECVEDLANGHLTHCPSPLEYDPCTWDPGCRTGYACTEVTTYQYADSEDCTERVTRTICLPSDRALWTEIPPEEIGLSDNLCDTQ